MSTKKGTADRDIKIQVRSFCPFVESCPYINELVCAECLRYCIAFERMTQQNNVVRIAG